MLQLVLAHLVAGAVAPLLLRGLGRRAFFVLALVPAATFAWALAQAGSVLDGRPVEQSVAWVPGLSLALDLRMGVLQWLMVLVVSGIGVLVLVYCRWYFGDRSALFGFACSLTAFMGAMLGLVLADNLLLLYVFWELTTAFSFLLIGFDAGKAGSRVAAIQAIVVTAMGGLVMLVGMLLLGQQAGSLSISEIVADPPTGTATTVAVMLLLVGALSKSAQVPFQFWLPGAMAAPTPVSAYLHAASMVKAGIYLIALLAPAFAATPGWHPVLLTLGTLTMVLAGWRALRQTDLKLLLAHGTVSQLGFLTVVLSIGSRTAALAGVAMLLAHALFKSCLFLAVGVIDKVTGTRDLTRLSGLGARMPALAVAGALAAASMAGLPPLLGFVGKETVWAALLELTEGQVDGVSPVGGWAVLIGLLIGSALTAGYTARWWWGAFARKPGVEATPIGRAPAGLLGPSVLLAACGLVLAFAGAALTSTIGGYADLLPAGEYEEYLALWHGLELPLLLSALTVAGGAGLFALRERICRLQTEHPAPVTAERLYQLTMRGVDRTAVEVTSLVQRGSLSSYLVIILSVVLAVPGAALVVTLVDGEPLQVTLWDFPGQAAVAAVMVLAAAATVRSRRRLRAVLLAGVTGYGCAVLFLMHGAPDIALTQILVETASIVVFVLVVRRLPEYFTDRPLRANRFLKMALAGGVGVAVSGFLLVAGGSRTALPISVDFAEQAYEFGYGRNVVNVTLVDIRAWDTLGEIAVLVAAATGVASLVFVGTRHGAIRRVRDNPEHAAAAAKPQARGRQSWLPAPRTLGADRRSIVFEVVTRLAFHTIIVFSVYLLLAGHNLPGGGFAGGIVAGLALVVRYLAGGRYELDEAAPVDAGVLIGTGLFVAALSGLGPTLFGGSVLQTADVYVPIPLLGEVHLVSSIGFDVGVYLVVVGLVLDLLRTFGSQLDRFILAEQDDPDDEQSAAAPAEVADGRAVTAR